MTSRYRRLDAYDGGFAEPQPCPPTVKHCIRISTRNPSWPERVSLEGMLPGMISRLGFRSGAAQLLGLGLKQEASRSYPPLIATGSDGQPDPQLLKLAASRGVDIAPGGWGPAQMLC